ncbi:MAG: 1-acyl-sn-glycerol-3-phosphate acyltransferase [Cyanobacteria bacterium P01_E01_bin.6]
MLDTRQDFYPPLMNQSLVRACQWILPPYARIRNQMTLQIEAPDLAQLKALKGKRVLLMPNHPTYYDDWIAVFILSAHMRQAFYYLSAHERFRGIEGTLIQRLGAYSIRRGLGDRPSVSMTRKLLMQPDCHLVIFPEGGCSYQNDTVMPFRVGAIQIAFQALSKLHRQNQTISDLHVVPLSIKYRYTQNMVPIIDQTLKKLEHELKLSPESKATLYQRLRAVAERLVDRLEHRHELPPLGDSSRSLNERITRLRAYWINGCETRLGITSKQNQPIRERVYKVQSVLEERAETIAAQNFGTYDSIHQIATNLLNFDALYDGYVAASPTPERFLDTLIRLERYVFRINYPPPKAHRQVVIRVGEPVNLRQHYDAYVGDRTQTIQQVTQLIQNTVQANLDGLAVNNQQYLPQL